MAYEVPALPYDYGALEPHIDEQTMRLHHDKHHQTYVDKVNAALEGTEWADRPIEEVLRNLDSLPDDKRTAVRNNGGGHANHTFFWQIMSPQGGGAPSGELAQAIEQAFGSFEDFKKKLADAGANQFGSGWAWLVADKGKLKLTHTLNGVDPLALGQTALLTCDVWEHAYYLDYQNRRPDFVQAFLDHLVNWDFVAQNLAKASRS
jgi:Fe-Mn family superoxide dismutase